MTVWIDEAYGTQQEKTRGDRFKWTRMFNAIGVSEFDAYAKIRRHIIKTYPVYSSQRLHSLTVIQNPDGAKLWTGEAVFMSPNLEQILDEDTIPNYSFSTKGGTAHITQSLKTVRVYPGWRPKLEYFETDEEGSEKKGFRPVRDENGKIQIERETPIDFQCGIGWNEEAGAFDGCDVTVPSWKSTIKIVVANQYIDQHFLRLLRMMTGTTNLLPFDGMSKGECLFLGCDGTRRVREIPKTPAEEESDEEGPSYELVWDLSFDFAGAPNRRQWIRNIGYVAKRGWEYMHIARRPVVLPNGYDTPEPESEEEDSEDEYQIVQTEEVDPEDTVDVEERTTTTTPIAAYIEQVYPYSDFYLLGFNNLNPRN